MEKNYVSKKEFINELKNGNVCSIKSMKDDSLILFYDNGDRKIYGGVYLDYRYLNSADATNYHPRITDMTEVYIYFEHDKKKRLFVGKEACSRTKFNKNKEIYLDGFEGILPKFLKEIKQAA